MQTAPERFSSSAIAALRDTGNELFLSAASSWEIAIKYALGRLPLPLPPAQYVPSRMESSGCLALAIEHRHALAIPALPPHHRDPFDRLLVAQAQIEGLTLLTADPQLERYDVELMRAK
jgi:PIN domain nuclease of toxin-antitoxin system